MCRGSYHEETRGLCPNSCSRTKGEFDQLAPTRRVDECKAPVGGVYVVVAGSDCGWGTWDFISSSSSSGIVYVAGAGVD